MWNPRSVTNPCFGQDPEIDPLIHLESLSPKGMGTGKSFHIGKDPRRSPVAPQAQGNTPGWWEPHILTPHTTQSPVPPGTMQGLPASGRLPCNLYITFARSLHISPLPTSTPIFFCHSNFISWAVWTAGSAVARSEVTPGTSSLFYMQMASHLGSRAGAQTV